MKLFIFNFTNLESKFALGFNCHTHIRGVLSLLSDVVCFKASPCPAAEGLVSCNPFLESSLHILNFYGENYNNICNLVLQSGFVICK
jgi:hypothetical protein